MYNLKIKIVVITLGVLYVTNSWASSDPTRPFFGGAISHSTKKYAPLVLQTIIKKNQKYKVVINGKLLNQGDSILGYRVNKINANNALLSKSDKQLTLSLFANNRLVKTVKK